MVTNEVLNEKIDNLRETVEKYHADNKESWEDYQKFKFKTIVDIVGLKFKSGVWGFIAGAIPASTVLIYLLIKYKT